MNDGNSLSFLKQLGLISTIVFEITIPPIGGLIIGYHVDKWLHTGPWFAIVLLVLGVAGGIKRVSFLMKKMSQKDK